MVCGAVAVGPFRTIPEPAGQWNVNTPCWLMHRRGFVDAVRCIISVYLIVLTTAKSKQNKIPEGRQT